MTIDLNTVVMDKVTHLIIDHYQDGLEQVILYGSRATGLITPESDHDFCVIISDDVKPISLSKEYELTSAIEDLVGPSDLLVLRRTRYEQNKQYPLNIEHKASQGHILHDSAIKTAPKLPLPTVAQVKVRAIDQIMRACVMNLSKASMSDDEMSKGIMIDDVLLFDVRAVCWSMKAQLALLDIDTTETSIRWNAAALANICEENNIVIDPMVKEVFCHIKDTDHLSEWTKDCYTMEHAIALRTIAFKVTQDAIKSMPAETLKSFNGYIESVINDAETLGMESFGKSAADAGKAIQLWFSPEVLTSKVSANRII